MRNEQSRRYRAQFAVRVASREHVLSTPAPHTFHRDPADQRFPMAEDLVFLMGKYEARIPGDRLYSKNHLWLKPAGDVFQVGFTAYSVRLLKDVYFLSWSVDPGASVQLKQEIGEIESSKALSSLYAPLEGRIVEFNSKLLNDPFGINTDGYGQGWLYTFETSQSPLSPEEYLALLESTWDNTQRVLKGQVNES